MKRILKLISLFLTICLISSALAACGKTETMMTLGDKRISVNVYEFLLSRMKGTLGYYGYDITSDEFWRIVISSDGKTYNDYFCEEVRRETAYYLIADKLFDDYGLALTKEQKKAIDDLMSSHEKQAGSRAALNEKLKAFGVNYDMLREIYTTESKIATLRSHLYGDEAQKVDDKTKQDYLDQNYVCFDQIFIVAYYYLTDLDRFDDTVYYTDEEHTAIAYDKVNGKTQTDETGKTATDIFGDIEYYTADGKIAYDKQNGVVGYVYEKDENGKYTENRVIEYYDAEKKGQLYNTAVEYASVCNGDAQKFEEYRGEHGNSDTADTVYLFASAGYYASLNSDAAYFDDIAEQLCKMKTNECRVVTSSYGYHVIFKRDNAKGAYNDKEMQKTYFADFASNLIEYLWSSLCEQYMKDVKIDQKVADKAPDMQEVNANVTY